MTATKKVIAAILTVMAIMTIVEAIGWTTEKNAAEKKIATMKAQTSEDQAQIKRLKHDIKTINKEVGDIKITYEGTFTSTFYTNDIESCGKTDGVTSTGAIVSDKTVATDPNVIPMGSLIYVSGIGFRIAEDTGGAIKGKKLDIYVDSAAEAKKLGVQHNRVYLIEEDE